MGSERLRAASCGLAGVLVAALVLPSCGERDEPPGLTKKSVALDGVPKTVVKAAGDTLRGVKIEEAWENRDREGKLHSYELRGRVPSTGKTREAQVAPDGRVLEVE